MGTCRDTHSGFTLIELSIVLVVIGLIIGAILVGRDLIQVSEVNATISQIGRFNAAVNIFITKFGALPGDVDARTANEFGFAPRGTQRGQGDNNGVIEGYNNGQTTGLIESEGETVMFWVDLTTANGLNLNLIDGSFQGAHPAAGFDAGTTIKNVLPQAKLGRGNYFYVWSGGIHGGNRINYYGLSAISSISSLVPASNPGLTVQQAYGIDKKMDDGYPQTGSITTMYSNTFGTIWAAGAHGPAGPFNFAEGADPGTAATPASWTCYDNGGNAANNMTYSMGQNSGTGNCALSIEFPQ